MIFFFLWFTNWMSAWAARKIKSKRNEMNEIWTAGRKQIAEEICDAKGFEKTKQIKKWTETKYIFIGFNLWLDDLFPLQ